MASSCMVHTSVMQSIGPMPEDIALRVCDDYATWMRVATQTNFAYLGEPLVVYRWEPETNLSGRENHSQWEILRRTLRDFLYWASGMKGLSPEYLDHARRVYYFALAQLQTAEKGLVKA